LKVLDGLLTFDVVAGDQLETLTELDLLLMMKMKMREVERKNWGGCR
jgi:hypothetical protein